MTTADKHLGRATALIVLSSCCFGSFTTLTLFITRRGMPLLPAMFWRYLLAVGVLYLLARQRRELQIAPRKAVQLVMIGALAQAAITYLSLRALDYLPVGPLAFLFYTYPAWVALIGGITGREELTLSRVLALSIAMGGVVVMIGMPSAALMNVKGIALGLGTALLYALYLPALYRAQAGVPPVIATLYLISGVLLSFLLASLYMRELRVPSSTELWALLIVLSLVSTVLAFLTMIAGLRTLGPLRASIVSTIEPFFTALLGVLLLGERFTAAMIIGGTMIAGAVILLRLSSRSSVPSSERVVLGK